MANQYINKIVYGGETLIDLTQDTADESTVLEGYTIHKADGSRVTGSCTYDADTSGVTAGASEVLSGKKIVKNGVELTGTMPNIGAQTGQISAKAQQVSISQGYHDGSGKVQISSTEQAKLIAGNIKSGVSILGVTGSYSGGESIKATTVSVTPAKTSQTVLPQDKGDYNYFTEVTVAAIPYSEADNTAGGKTATIG